MKFVTDRSSPTGTPPPASSWNWPTASKQRRTAASIEKIDWVNRPRHQAHAARIQAGLDFAEPTVALAARERLTEAGRGAVCLKGANMGIEARYPRSTSFHEAGHAVVAWSFGVPMGAL